MHSNTAVTLRQLVLVGGGHSHLGVLRHLAQHPLPGVGVVLISNDVRSPYSGMLPGYVAGHYGYEDVMIDLRRLATCAGARFVCDEVVAVDRKRQLVHCLRQPPVAYDRLSINVGSVPTTAQVAGAAEYAIPVKPIPHFDARWRVLCERVSRSSQPTTIAVVGAGVSGVELTLAMQYRLQCERRASGHPVDNLSFRLFSDSDSLLPNHNRRVRGKVEAVLATRGVIVHRASHVNSVARDRLVTANGEVVPVDEIVWATQASGAPWLRDCGLELDERGFIRIGATLQSVADPLIFAAGDCAAMSGRRLEKAGVFAVRQGRPLADNLRRSLFGRAPRPWHPQRHWLALISTGDRYAIAARGDWATEGAWVWRWKDWIDRRFVARFNTLPLPNRSLGESM